MLYRNQPFHLFNIICGKITLKNNRTHAGIALQRKQALFETSYFGYK